MTYILIIICAILFGVCLLLKKYRHLVIREVCDYCEGDSFDLDYLSKEERVPIDRFFQKVVKQMPWSETTQVCKDCKKVYCWQNYYTWPKCLACGHSLDTIDDACQICQAPYEWVCFEQCDNYYFYVPVKTDTALDL